MGLASGTVDFLLFDYGRATDPGSEMQGPVLSAVSNESEAAY